MTELLDRRLFKPGSKIVRAGDDVHKVVLIVRGRCRIEPKGMSRSFVFGPGSLLGLRPIFEKHRHPRHLSTAVALEPVEAVFMDAEDLRREFGHLPAEMKMIFQSLCIGSQTLAKIYDQASEDRHKVLAGLATEIDTLIRAELN
ncbi:cyclic nucleotide-binding domain-containing protein [Nisaea sp.]|uniref:cyclic nucleotide-binding domain-containing protein n=1 Tax=Nisaea sp. TaxID=2024842 RepID=UPI003B527D27